MSSRADRRDYQLGSEYERVPNPVDVHVGGRLRQRRILMGFSQERLGQAIGLTFQQVQKYERGLNRIGASRLFDLSQVLGTDVNYFFDGMSEEVAKNSPVRWHVLKEQRSPYLAEENPIAKRETLELVRTYYRIDSDNLRKSLFELAKALATHSSISATPSKEPSGTE